MAVQNSVKLVQGSWIWDRSWEMNFPENWKVDIFTHREIPVLDENEIIEKIEKPVGSLYLENLVKAAGKVLIICDDLSRPTRTDIILPVLIELLVKHGISKEQVSILIAAGTHAPMSDGDVDLKIGRKVAREHKVYRHNYRKKGTYLGKTAQGTPVFVNRQIVKHDLVIGVGGIYPHSTAGFSGGAKLILGVCSIRTIMHFHLKRKGAPTGGNIDNAFRKDVLDAAGLARMDFIINSMINSKREITEVVSGEVDRAFQYGVEIARKSYGVPKPDPVKYDLIIADTYPFDASYAFARKGWWPVWNLSGDCYKLLLSSMHEGKGGHLIYPIPMDRRINKLKRLYYELMSFGIGNFLTTSMGSRLKKHIPGLDKKRKSNRISDGTKTRHTPGDSEITGGHVHILHHATGKAKDSLEHLPNKRFDNAELFIDHLKAKTGNKPLNVALYKASSLTYPA